jgi:protein TonB
VLRNFVLALSVVLAAVCAAGQQPATPLPPQPASTQTVSTPSVYAAGPDVTAPQLIPASFPTESVPHCNKNDGQVYLVAIIGPDGKPGNIVTLEPNNSAFEEMAKRILTTERFKPGVHNGVPVSVAILADLSIQLCAENAKSADGTSAIKFVLRSQPDQRVSAPPAVPPVLLAVSDPGERAEIPGIEKVGPKVSAPVAIYQPDEAFTQSTPKKRTTGVCFVGLIVDADGKPQNVHLVVSLEPSSDQYAIELIKHDQFKPAMKDGHPVAVRVNVEVNFQLRK